MKQQLAILHQIYFCPFVRASSDLAFSGSRPQGIHNRVRVTQFARLLNIPNTAAAAAATARAEGAEQTNVTEDHLVHLGGHEGLGRHTEVMTSHFPFPPAFRKMEGGETHYVPLETRDGYFFLICKKISASVELISRKTI